MWAVQGWRRLRRSLGWTGGLTVLLGLAIAVALALGGRQSFSAGLVRPLLLSLLGLGYLAWRWGTYTASARTRPAQDVVPALVSSREEFCLLLRPFGSDGESLVPVVPRRAPRAQITATWTLEQVVADAARTTLGMATYAIVDQGLTLAPPGPVYLRAADDAWKRPARALILRAHTIFIVLAEAQEVRPSLQWELDEIVRARRQSRVVLVLPVAVTRSPQARAEQVAALRRLAALVLAALERPRPGPVGASDVRRALEEVPPDAFVVQVRRYGPDHRGHAWVALPLQPGWFARHVLGRSVSRRGAPVAAHTYQDALVESMTVGRDRLARLTFEQRYPSGTGPASTGPARGGPARGGLAADGPARHADA